MKGDDYMPDRKIEELSELEFDVLKEYQISEQEMPLQRSQPCWADR